MFSISDIKQEAYPAAYRRGKELYERGLVQEFSYDVYTEDGVPKAELIGRVKGTVEDHYDVRLVIDEEYAEVSESRCNCEAFCNYEGICKHCVAVALAYVNRRQAKDILNAKLGVSEKTEQKDIRTEKELKTDTSLKNLLNRYSMRAGSTYLLPENIYGIAWCSFGCNIKWSCDRVISALDVIYGSFCSIDGNCFYTVV